MVTLPREARDALNISYLIRNRGRLALERPTTTLIEAFLGNWLHDIRLAKVCNYHASLMSIMMVAVVGQLIRVFLFNLDDISFRMLRQLIYIQPAEIQLGVQPSIFISHPTVIEAYLDAAFALGSACPASCVLPYRPPYSSSSVTMALSSVTTTLTSLAICFVHWEQNHFSCSGTSVKPTQLKWNHSYGH
jgi:hypothetical protein